ncbi:MAG: hypothetical protein LBV78_18940, partial [Kitasatospora sp.]|nr:hypothetical protein [Kitasatospora sp.]
LATALLPGLPVPLHCPVAVLRNRLQRKMPPVAAARAAAAARYSECATCHDPVPRPGICVSCAGLEPRRPATGSNATTRAGVARVRDALRAAKAALPLGLPATFTG